MFHLSIDEGIARLSLNRPEARNAIPAGSWSKLADLAHQCMAKDARILLVTGSQGAFCAGADLRDFVSLRSDAAARSRFREAMGAALDQLRSLGIPTVAVINGACFGAGVALAMACDWRVAGEHARFAIPPARLGLSYPQRDVHALVALVGPGQAARLLFGGETIDAAEAARIGLVEQYVTGDVEAAAHAMARSAVGSSAASLASLKRGIRLAVLGNERDRGQDEAFDQSFSSELLAERLSRLNPPS